MSGTVASVFGRRKAVEGVNYSPASLSVACPRKVAEEIADIFSGARTIYEACGGLGTNTIAFIELIPNLEHIYVHEARADRLPFLDTNLKAWGKPKSKWTILRDDERARADTVFFDMGAVDDPSKPLGTYPENAWVRVSGHRKGVRHLLDGTGLIQIKRKGVQFAEQNNVRYFTMQSPLSPNERMMQEYEFEERNKRLDEEEMAELKYTYWVNDLRMFIYDFLLQFLDEDIAERLVDPEVMPLWANAFTKRVADLVNNYERDELIGDRLLEPPFVAMLFRRFPQITPETVTKLKTLYLSKSWQASKAQEWGFGQMARVMPAGAFLPDEPMTEKTGEVTIHTLEDIFEAFQSALFFAGEKTRPGLGYHLVSRLVNWMFEGVEIAIEADYTDDITSVQSTLKTLGVTITPVKQTGFEMWEEGTKTLKLVLSPAMLKQLRAHGIKLDSSLSYATGNTLKAARIKAYKYARVALQRSGAEDKARAIYEKRGAISSETGKKALPIQTRDEFETWAEGLREAIYDSFGWINNEDISMLLVDSAEKMGIWADAFTHVGYDPVHNNGHLGELGHWLLVLAFTLMIDERAIRSGISVDEGKMTDIIAKYLNREFQSGVMERNGLAAWLRVGTEPDKAALNEPEKLFERFGLANRPTLHVSEQRLARELFEKEVRRHGYFSTPIKKSNASLGAELRRQLLNAFAGALFTVGENSAPGIGLQLVRAWVQDMYRAVDIDLRASHVNPVTMVQQSFDRLHIPWRPIDQFEFTDQMPDGRYRVSLVLSDAAWRKLANVGLNLSRLPTLSTGYGEDQHVARQKAYNAAADILEAAGMTPQFIQNRRDDTFLRTVPPQLLKTVRSKLAEDRADTFRLESSPVGGGKELIRALLIGQRHGIGKDKGKIYEFILAHATGTNEHNAFMRALEAYAEQ